MENILLVWTGHQFFLEYLVGPPNKIQSLSVKMYENNCKNFNVNVHNTPDESLCISYRNCSLYLAIAAEKNGWVTK